MSKQFVHHNIILNFFDKFKNPLFLIILFFGSTYAYADLDRPVVIPICADPTSSGGNFSSSTGPSLYINTTNSSQNLDAPTPGNCIYPEIQSSNDLFKNGIVIGVDDGGYLKEQSTLYYTDQEDVDLHPILIRYRELNDWSLGIEKMDRKGFWNSLNGKESSTAIQAPIFKIQQSQTTIVVRSRGIALHLDDGTRDTPIVDIISPAFPDQSLAHFILPLASNGINVTLPLSAEQIAQYGLIIRSSDVGDVNVSYKDQNIELCTLVFDFMPTKHEGDWDSIAVQNQCKLSPPRPPVPLTRPIILSKSILPLYGFSGVAPGYSGDYQYLGGAKYDFWWVIGNYTRNNLSDWKITALSNNVKAELSNLYLNSNEDSPLPVNGGILRGPYFDDSTSVNFLINSAGYTGTVACNVTEGEEDNSYSYPVEVQIFDSDVPYYHLYAYIHFHSNRYCGPLELKPQ